jgi:hypothetical protein
LGLAFILTWYFIPPWLYRSSGDDANTRLKAITDTRTALLAGLIGLGALLTFSLNRKVYEVAARNLEVTERGQLTDRYSSAIELLGGQETEQIGGVYALERIMRDAAEYHNTIIEVLIGFVRQHAATNVTDSPSPKPEAPEPVSNRQPGREDGKSQRLATPIQAALVVLGRRPNRPDEEMDGLRLSDTDLRRLRLRGANLRCARLRRARLDHAHLEYSNFDGARMRSVILDHADLEGAHLDYAHLVGASLIDTKLKRASLMGTHLAGAKGNPTLTEEQQKQAHCLPSAERCSNTRPPEDHPCARYEW